MAVPDALIDASLNAAAVDHAGAHVERLYRLLLNREPDGQGFVGWMMRAAAGENITEAFWQAVEAGAK